MRRRNDDTDGWRREQIAEIIRHGWTLDELESIGITRALLTRLGFRDDHPRLFDDPIAGTPVPDPGGPRQHGGTEAASPTRRDAASSLWDGASGVARARAVDQPG